MELQPFFAGLVISQDQSGQAAYIMYHGTTLQNANSIKQNGFVRSKDGMLGPGIYVTRSFQKAAVYPIILPPGEVRVILRLTVRVGNVKRIDYQGHPLQKTWHQAGYDTAWVPPNCGMVRSGLEENCVWDPKRIDVLEVLNSYGSTINLSTFGLMPGSFGQQGPSSVPPILGNPFPQPLPLMLGNPFPQPVPQMLGNPCPQPLPLMLGNPFPQPVPQMLGNPFPQPVPQMLANPFPQPLSQMLGNPYPQPLTLMLGNQFPQPLPPILGNPCPLPGFVIPFCPALGNRSVVYPPPAPRVPMLGNAWPPPGPPGPFPPPV